MKRLFLWRNLLPLLLLVLPTLGRGQDTLMQDTGLDYQISFNASGRLLRGTFNQSVFASGLDLQLTGNRWEVHNTTRYRYNNIGGAQVEDNWYQLFILSYLLPKRRVLPLAFYLFDNNLLFRINARHMGGGGIGLIQDTWKHTYLRLDLGAGYESTLYDGSDFVNTPSADPRREKPLAFARLTHSHNFWDKKISLDNLIVYRLSLIERADYYLLIRPKLSLTIRKSLSVNLSYEYRYEHVYLLDLSPTNTIFLAGLTYTLHSKH